MHALLSSSSGIFSQRSAIPISLDDVRRLIDHVTEDSPTRSPEFGWWEWAADLNRFGPDKAFDLALDWATRVGDDDFDLTWRDVGDAPSEYAGDKLLIDLIDLERRTGGFVPSAPVLAALEADEAHDRARGLTPDNIVVRLHSEKRDMAVYRQAIDEADQLARTGHPLPYPALVDQRVEIIQNGNTLMTSNVVPLFAAEADALEEARPAIAATPFKWSDPSLIPQRQWLYGTFLSRGQVAATVAHPGVGKSALTIVEALALASGRRLLHDEIQEGPVRVWLWNLEDPLDELRRRIAAAALHYKIDAPALNRNLFVDSGRAQSLTIARGGRDGAVIDDRVFAELVETIRANAIDVLIVDPLVSAHQVPENDNGAIDMVAKAFASLADMTNAAVHLVHHSRKTGGEAVEVENARGASALIGAVRSARTLNLMSPEEAAQAGVENRLSFVRIDDGKANLAPRSDKAAWLRHHSVTLNNGPDGSFGDSVGVVTPWRWPDAMDGVKQADVAAVKEAVRGGRWRENIQARDWVGHAVAKALSLNLSTSAEKAKVKALVRRWIGNGTLAIVEGKDANGDVRSFVEAGET